MVLFVASEVFARYVLAYSIFFANELARLMFVWTIFLGLPLALGRGHHVGVELLRAVLPSRVWEIVFRLNCIASAALMVVVIWQTIFIMLDNWDQRMSTLPLSAGFFTLPITIGASLALLHLVNMLITAHPAPMADEKPTDDQE